jgi:DUF3096 family protein
MNITLSLAPLISLLAGILILVVPRMLNYIVARLFDRRRDTGAVRRYSLELNPATIGVEATPPAVRPRC